MRVEPSNGQCVCRSILTLLVIPKRKIRPSKLGEGAGGREDGMVGDGDVGVGVVPSQIKYFHFLATDITGRDSGALCLANPCEISSQTP